MGTLPSAERSVNETSFRAFLDSHLEQEMLRFSTAGSVDDGKSTLIGRLLHDTKSVYEDQLASIRASRVNRSGGAVDLSLLTDGLKAEREQGITIDVAYRYFSTAKRKFIIADTPGHEQYTRNMATGASTADVAIVLIDAKAFQRAGELLPQSRRHTYIASLLRIPHVVAAINKMDLVNYSPEIFDKVSAEFTALAKRLGLKSVEVIPVSALAGDNVVEHSTNMGWYRGPTLLQYLETVPLTIPEAAEGPLRFPVQLVVRPDAEFRGFAGRVERGEVRPGMRVKALPSGQVTTVKSIVTYDGELALATFPLSVTIELEDEIDLSRGEMLIGGQTYLAKHTTRTVRATARRILYGVDIHSTEKRECSHLQMNDIAEVEFDTSLPLFFDAYAMNREMGALILIDAVTNATVGAAMIVDASEPLERSATQAASGAFVWLRGLPDEAATLRDDLRRRGRAAVIVDDPLIPEASLPGVVRALQLVDVSAISARPSLSASTLAAIQEVAGEEYIESPESASKWLDGSSKSTETQ